MPPIPGVPFSLYWEVVHEHPKSIPRARLVPRSSITTNLLNQSLGRYHILEQLGEGGEMPSANKVTNKRIASQDFRLFVKIRGWIARPT